MTVSAQASGPVARLRLAVSDTGAGIAEGDRAGLFDAFVQADGTSTRAHEGAGLGLAISSRLTALLGGAITVESELGRGSTFTLTLDASLIDAPAPAAPDRTATEAPHDGALSILVVDDNRINQRVITLLLLELGYTADAAGNGLKAIEAIERQRYDLVFMDIQMPELNGLDATRIIRRRWPQPDLRPLIVGLSGYASDETRHECLAAGMDGYLPKPVTLAQLADTIQRLRASAAR